VVLAQDTLTIRATTVTGCSVAAEERMVSTVSYKKSRNNTVD